MPACRYSATFNNGATCNGAPRVTNFDVTCGSVRFLTLPGTLCAHDRTTRPLPVTRACFTSTPRACTRNHYQTNELLEVSEPPEGPCTYNVKLSIVCSGALSLGSIFCIT